MTEYSSGAYIVSRKGRRGGRGRDPRRRPNRAAGILVIVLLLLTAGICLLVVFLPEFKISGVGGAADFSGKTFYFLTTGKATDRLAAREQAQYAIERGGAGYIYNDGNYRIVAAAYEREADAKTLASVNADADYFAFSLPSAACDGGDKATLEYLAGELFTVCATAATELDRGNITEASAEYAVSSALDKLVALACSASSERIKSAASECAYYEIPQGRSVLSYIRYVQVRMLVVMRAALV